MKLVVVSVYDIVSQVFSPPMLYRSVAEAKRHFDDLCISPQSPLGSHPEDLKLMDLGRFDDCDGVFSQSGPAILLSSGRKGGEIHVLQPEKPAASSEV